MDLKATQYPAFEQLSCNLHLVLQWKQRVTDSPLNNTNMDSVRIYITDGKRRFVDLCGSDTSFSILLKPRLCGHMSSREFILQL